MPSSAQRSSLRIETQPFQARQNSKRVLALQDFVGRGTVAEESQSRRRARPSTLIPVSSVGRHLRPIVTSCALISRGDSTSLRLVVPKVLHVVNGPDPCWPAHINRAIRECFTIVGLARFDGTPRRCYDRNAGWSSLVARWAHNPKVGGSNPPPATNGIIKLGEPKFRLPF